MDVGFLNHEKGPLKHSCKGHKKQILTTNIKVNSSTKTTNYLLSRELFCLYIYIYIYIYIVLT